jgi:tRNA 5-methylaminomethyl-2-thiouridine biosynthesis bifunctional protein
MSLVLPEEYFNQDDSCELKLNAQPSKIKPYFIKPAPLQKQTQKIAIIGAGMAGCAVAYELAKHGFDIHIYDKNDTLAEGASGNLAGMLKPYFTADTNTSDLFHTRGFYETLSFLESLGAKAKDAFEKTGALQLLSDQKEKLRYERIFSRRDLPHDLLRKLSSEEALKLTDLLINEDAIFYQNASLVSPMEYCRLLIDEVSGNVTMHFNIEVKNISQGFDKLWRINNGELYQFDAIVVAGGAEVIKTLAHTRKIPVYLSQGQVSYIELDDDLKCMLSEKGYVTPKFKGVNILGATYRENHDLSGEIREEDHISNFKYLDELIPQHRAKLLSGRVSTRCVTSDHMPIVGAVPDYQQFINVYQQDFKKGTTLARLKDCPYHQGLFISSGFGSRGLCASLLAAKILSSLITGDSLPVSSKVYEAIHPSRFWVKQLRKPSF